MTNKTSWRGEVDVEPGDLIEIFRMGYKHWAVYVGLGNVVHLTQLSKTASSKSFWGPTAVIKIEKLSDVVGKDRYRVNNKHDSKYPVRTPDEIISLAKKLEGKTVKYKVTSNNCEHFANYMRYNVSQSDQAWDWGFIITMIGLILLLI